MPAKAMPARQLPQWDPLVGVAQESLTGVACQRHRGILGELTKRASSSWWLSLNSTYPIAHPEGGRSRKAKGRLGGRRSKFKPNQAKRLLELNDSVTYTQTGLAELFDPR